MGKTDNTPMTDNLFIKELIRRVHDELIESQEEREINGIAPLFTVKDMTIEVNFVAEKSLSAKGGLDFKVVTVGGNTDIKSQQIHKITLNLEVDHSSINQSYPDLKPSNKKRDESSIMERFFGAGANPFIEE